MSSIVGEFLPFDGLNINKFVHTDTLMVLLKEFFEKVDFEKDQQTTKKLAKLPSNQRVNQSGQ